MIVYEYSFFLSKIKQNQSYVKMLLVNKKIERTDFMSHNNDYIRNLLNLKDNNIKFFDNFCHDGFRKGKSCKIINAFLSYIPNHCDKCGVIFNSKKDFEKKGFDKGSYIVFPSVCKTDLVNYGCFISNITKHYLFYSFFLMNLNLLNLLLVP